jgi:hypothetical protein
VISEDSLQRPDIAIYIESSGECSGTATRAGAGAGRIDGADDGIAPRARNVVLNQPAEILRRGT